jgi:hypothetical protein
MDQLSFMSDEVMETIASTKGTKLAPNTLKILQALAAINAPKTLLACLLEMAEFSIHHIRYLAGPLVLHCSLWSDVIPEWLKLACVQDRLELIISEYEKDNVGDYATPAEVLTYMMPATMEAPMHREYVDLYLWAGNEVMQKHHRLPENCENFYELIGDRPIEFSRIKTEFHDLSRSIRQSVVKHAAQQGWGKRRDRTRTNPVNDVNLMATTSDNSSSSVQISLF